MYFCGNSKLFYHVFFFFCNFCVIFPLHHHTTTISSVESTLLKPSKPNRVQVMSVSYLDRYAVYSDWFIVVFLSLSLGKCEDDTQITYLNVLNSSLNICTTIRYPRRLNNILHQKIIQEYLPYILVFCDGVFDCVIHRLL